MINQDLQIVGLWWLMFFFVGLISLPLAWIFLRRFFDSGYGIAKTIGVVSITYLVFVLSTLKILPLTRTSMMALFIIYCFINVWIYWKNKRQIKEDFSNKIKILLFEEVLFFLGLLGWAFVRAHQPDIRGLEKFMDFGFINSILRSKYLPPVDMWAAGKPINYYWFGHLMTAVLTKLSGIELATTYNLMIATILGLTATSAFSITTSLLANSLRGGKTRAIIFGGFLSAILLTMGGNFHTPYYVIKEGYQKYWYPDATRFIGYNPETNDKTIHEFPSYSFIVSDLHGHLLDLPIVLLYIALLMNYIVISRPKLQFSNPKSEIQNPKQYQNSNDQKSKPNQILLKQFKKFEFGALKLFRNLKLEIGNSQNKTINLPLLIPLGFILGVMFMTNTWDFGIYLLVSAVTLATYNLAKKKLSWDFIYETSKTILVILVVGILIALPFILNFSSIAQGVAFVKARTPIWQLAILWGFPALLTIVFLASFIKERKIVGSKTFVLSLLIASWILILLPEIIFVKDIYIGSHHRANTMFKLTYQGFVVFYLVSGYIITSTLLSIKPTFLKILGSLGISIILASILIYPYFGITSFYQELKNYHGLNGEAWLEKEYPGEYGALIWLRENTSGQPTILEAAGDSYTDFNVISAYSGLPTVSGWFVHEWLWRGSSEIPQKRANDVSAIYLTESTIEAKNLLTKYNVRYIVVGTFEKQKYPNLIEQKFEDIGRLVFSQKGTKIYQFN